MEFTPGSLPWKSMYKLMIGSIVPRPIGWISTVDEAGTPNLAPFSFFNAAGANPPHVLFCPTVRETDAGPKDTLRNARATGEFVVNIVTEALGPAMNLTSAELAGDVDEFAVAGLATAPSALVRPPRVAESPIHFECRVAHILDLGQEPGGASVVIGVLGPSAGVWRGLTQLVPSTIAQTYRLHCSLHPIRRLPLAWRASQR